MSPRVDHAAPIHDGFCRCRACKPPLVGEQRDHALRLAVAGSLAGLAACAALLAEVVRS